MYEQKTMTFGEYKAEQSKRIEHLEKIPLEERLEKVVAKMLRIVKANTGASKLYADMLLSMLPNSTHQVNMAYWCYKADMDDFYSILELMEKVKNGSKIIWEYEELVLPFTDELEKYLESKKSKK